MQNRVERPGPLLDENGCLIEAGYAVSLVKRYDRNAVKANKLRIKEWDYYLVSDGHRGLALTVADNGYMGMLSASWLNFDEPCETTSSIMTVLPAGSFHMPADSSFGNVSYRSSKIDIAFYNDGKERRLCCTYPGFRGKETLQAEVILTDMPKDSMVILTPYSDDPKAFYYNQKINCMRAAGTVTVGREKYCFAPDTAFGVLDWGRGVWTYSNTWYWSSLSAALDGHRFGFNLGYGFGDTSAATENMLFYDGTAHKLEDVVFHIPLDEKGKEKHTDQWQFTSSDGRLNMTFDPVIDRASCTDFKILKSDQHQVFGRFSGTAVLDDGTQLQFKNLPGFAEKVMNRW